MNRLFPHSLKLRLLSSRLGSLLLLFQRSPIIQMIFPEAKIIGGAGLGEIAKWTVATVAGLGAYDSVAGATTIAQISPTAGSNTVNAILNSNLTFVFQLTGYSHTPGSWKVTGLPSGLTHADAKNNTVDSVSGSPTTTGTYSVGITAYSGTNYTGDKFSKTFTMVVDSNLAAAKIVTNPSSITIASGQTTTLQVTAGGDGPFTYQWYRGVSGNTTTPVGTNSPTFTTPPLTTLTYYWVKVSNAANPTGANSGTATITVITPPAIETDPASQYIASGQTATLSVAASGSGPLTYRWYQGSSGETGTPVGTNSSTFTTPPLTETTSYWVKVSNVANTSGVNSGTAVVSILKAPGTDVQQPAGTHLVDGVSATNFGNVRLGETGTLSFTVQNPGTASLPGLAASVTGTNAADYQITQPATTVLGAEESTTFDVTFRPTAAGTREAVLHVASGMPDEKTFDVVLTGTGFQSLPEIAVQQPKGTNLVDGKASRKFGSTAVGKKGRVMTFAILNTGSVDLTKVSAAIAGTQRKDFILSKLVSSVVHPGAKLTFQVTFAPTAAGNRSGVLKIRSNDADENPFDIKLSGLGTR